MMRVNRELWIRGSRFCCVCLRVLHGSILDERQSLNLSSIVIADMTEVVLVKFKIKPGKKQEWINWCAELKERKDEVVRTLRNEGVISEACFLSEKDQFVYYFLEAQDLERAYEIGRKSAMPINRQHHTIREATLERGEELKTLFNFRS